MTMEIILAAALGLICIIIILFNPYFGLIMFTSLLYLRPADFLPALAPLHIARLIAAITFLVMLFKKGGQQGSIFKNSRQMQLLIILLLIMFLSITTSIWKTHSLEYIINFLKIFISFLLVINLANSVKRLKGIIWVMILSGLVLGIASVTTYSQEANLMSNYRVNAMVSGMFGNPNDLALCFVMLIPFAYFVFVKNRSIFMKLLSGASLVIFVIGTIFTKSRGGALGLLGVILFLFLKSKSKFMAGLGLSLCILLFFSLAPAEYVDRIKTIPTSHQDDINTISRLDAWEAGIAMMAHRPLGIGVGNFGEGFVHYRPEGAKDFLGMRRAAHNTFIQIGAETGILGLIAFSLLIITVFRSLSRTKNSAIRFRSQEGGEIVSLADAVFISMVGFIICAFFLSQAYNWILYYLVGFSVVLSELTKGKSYQK